MALTLDEPVFEIQVKFRFSFDISADFAESRLCFFVLMQVRPAQSLRPAIEASQASQVIQTLLIRGRVNFSACQVQASSSASRRQGGFFFSTANFS